MPTASGSRCTTPVCFPEIPAGLLHKPALVAWLAKHGKALAPLVIWLHRNIG
jgi:hypothetical protein